MSNDERTIYINLKTRFADVSKEVERQVTAVSGLARKAATAYKDLEREIQHKIAMEDGSLKTIKAQTSEYEKLLTAARQQKAPLEDIYKLEEKIHSLRKQQGESYKDITNKMTGAGMALSIGLTAPLLLAGNQAMKTAGQFEKYEKTLKTMLGSTQAAQQRMNDYVKIAMKTPFELSQVVTAGNQLQALGRYSEQTLIQLGDLAAASGKPMEQALSAFAKMATGQKGEAVNMFRDLLISVEDFQAATGKRISRNGELLASTEELIAAIPKILETKNFSGMMDEQSKTIEGQMSNLSDSVTNLLGGIGKAFLPTAKEIVAGVTEIVNNFNEMDEGTKKFIGTMAILAASAGPVLLVSAKLVEATGSLGGVIGKLPGIVDNASAGLKKLGTTIAANPIIAIAAAVTAVTVGVGMYVAQTYNANNINKDLQKTVEGLNNSYNTYQSLTRQLTTDTKNLSEAEKNLLEIRKDQEEISIMKQVADFISGYNKMKGATVDFKSGLIGTQKDRQAAIEATKKHIADLEKIIREGTKDKEGIITYKGQRQGGEDALKALLAKEYQSLESLNTPIIKFEENMMEMAKFVLTLKDNTDLYNKVLLQIPESARKELDAKIKILETQTKINKANETETKSVDYKQLEKQYQEYIKNKEVIDNKSNYTFQAYQKSKAIIEKMLNDDLFKSYVEYREKIQKEDAKSNDEYKKAEKEKLNFTKDIASKNVDIINDKLSLLNKNYNKEIDLAKNNKEEQKKIEDRYSIEESNLNNERLQYQKEVLAAELELEKIKAEETYKDKAELNQKLAALDDIYSKKAKQLDEESRQSFIKSQSGKTEAAKTVMDELNNVVSNVQIEPVNISIDTFQWQSDVEYIENSFKGAASLLSKINAGIFSSFQSTFGKINGIIDSFDEKIKNAGSSSDAARLEIQKNFSIGLVAAGGIIEAFGQTANAVFDFVLDGLSDKIKALDKELADYKESVDKATDKSKTAIDEETNARLRAIDRENEERLRKENAAKDESQKLTEAELEEKINAMRVANYTEVELAQQKYDELLAADEDYKSSQEEKRANELEAYRESLSNMTDAEIEKAIADKERELKNTEEKDGLTKQETLKKAKSDLEKQKILVDGEAKKKAVEEQAAKDKEARELAIKKKQYDLEVQAFNAKKAMDIMNIWIAAAMCAVMAFANAAAWPGPSLIAGLAMAGALTAAVGIAAGIETGFIAAQQPPPPAFQEGGVIPGNSYAGDQVNIRANSAERVLTQRQNDAFEDFIYNTLPNLQNLGEILLQNNIYLDGQLISEQVTKYIVENRRLSKARS